MERPYPGRLQRNYQDRRYRNPFAFSIGRYGYPAALYPYYGLPDAYGRNDRDFWDRASDEVYSWFGDEEAERQRWRDRHRGKGPKGYVRTDERILKDISDHMSEDGMLDASKIEVSVADGEVTLSGSLSNRFEKRRAEDCADSISGVRHTQNDLRIVASGTGG